MKRIRIISWLLPCICAAAAVAPASGQTKVKTSVEKVTLFIDGAQVTRTKQIDLPAGNSTLVFTGLSPYLDDKSMQVAAKGKFTVTAVNRLFNHTDSLERSARQKALEQELARIRLEQQQQKAAREVIDAETDLLKVNCSVGNRNAATPLAAIKELNEYYASRMQELKRRTLELDGRTKALGERERQVLADLAQLGGRQSAPMSEVEVRIEAPAACKGAFTLTYYVRNAGWFPSYDIRSGGLSEPVEISYKANIFQNTREEWKNVGLTLSSSNPTTGNIAPQLKTWWLDYGTTPPRYDSDLTGNTVSGTVFDEQREPLIGASVLVPGTTVGTSTDAQGRYSVTVPDGASSLQFNYIGYKSQTRAIAGSTMNVVMQEDNARLDEVVVTAYGSAPSAALSGKAAGVRVRGKAAPAMEAEFIELAEDSAPIETAPSPPTARAWRPRSDATGSRRHTPTDRRRRSTRTPSSWRRPPTGRNSTCWRAKPTSISRTRSWARASSAPGRPATRSASQWAATGASASNARRRATTRRAGPSDRTRLRAWDGNSPSATPARSP